MAGGDGETAHVVTALPDRRHEVGQGQVGLALGLVHLLAQGEQARPARSMRVSSVLEDDVVAVGLGPARSRPRPWP